MVLSVKQIRLKNIATSIPLFLTGTGHWVNHRQKLHRSTNRTVSLIHTHGLGNGQEPLQINYQ